MEEHLTKTVIVHGLNDEEHQNEVRRKIEEWFDVRESYTIQNSHKILCVMFYDERKAAEAVRYLREAGVSSHHTISKYEIPRDAERCDESKNQSTLLYTFKNSTQPVDEDEFLEKVSEYGEVKDVRHVKSVQKCVEFYDARSAAAAFHGMNDTDYGDGIVQTRWVWDLSIKTRWEMIRVTDNTLKECKIDVRPAKREGDEPREEGKRRRVEGLARSMFVRKFDAFIAKNIDLISGDYVGQ